MEQMEHMEHAKNDYLNLLNRLIAQAGKRYGATDNEIMEMQTHVLQFIERHPDNFAIAIKGFTELAQAC